MFGRRRARRRDATQDHSLPREWQRYGERGRSEAALRSVVTPVTTDVGLNSDRAASAADIRRAWKPDATVPPFMNTLVSVGHRKCPDYGDWPLSGTVTANNAHLNSVIAISYTGPGEDGSVGVFLDLMAQAMHIKQAELMETEYDTKNRNKV